jgi:hypothetical protein
MSMQTTPIRLHGRPALPTTGAEKPRSKGLRFRTAHVLWATTFLVGLIVFVAMPQRELPLYVLAGERMLHGESIYRIDERAFTYPPLFALPFVPLTYLPQAAQRVVWYAINFAALAIIFVRLRRRLEPILPVEPTRWTASPWLFWGLVVLIAGRHVSAVLENQSHDLIVFLGTFLAVDALCSARPKVAGLWAGLATALKATPLLFAPVFAWQRRWAACACLASALVAGTLLPDAVLPARDGVSWTVTWYRTFLTTIRPGETAASTRAWYPWNQLNQSLAGTCYRLFTPPTPDPDRYDVSLLYLDRTVLRALTLGCQLATLAWLLWLTRPKLTQHLTGSELSFARLGQGAALLTAMVLLSPTSIKTHFCVLLVPAVYCLADFLYRRRDPLVGAALAAAFVLGTLTAKGIVTKQLGDHVMAYGTVTACAIALYLATGRVLLQRVREASTLHQPNSIAPRAVPNHLRAAA